MIGHHKGKVQRLTDGDYRQELPQLSFNDEKLIGGDNVTASQNIMYDAVNPIYVF